ncbi:helix-turn-helix domain-containing protein [Christensenellaceae bacterium OttesenSCG-928-M15]|nr:helix-turn-helix domain-containing protein [Christensenellaceae bacterium OttesenSCG-928-M15]
MKEYYSIGETAKLFNTTVQTLRYYEQMELFAPDYVNPNSGYRYYSYKQFHYLDRIHYLKGLGLSLKEIYEILKSGQVDSLQYFLKKNLQERQEELKKLQETVQDLQWYSKYFEYMDNTRAEGAIYVSHIEERYLLSAPCTGDEVFENIELRLTKLRSRDEFKNLGYRRHYCFIIDFDDMLNQHFSPTAASIYLKNKPDFVSPYFTVLPAGNYLCFKAKLRLDEWNSAEVKRFFQNSGYKAGYVVANEYEDNLVEYTATPYEVQVYLNGAV